MPRKPKKPIFIDEEIQWHLNSSRHDRCPLCGFREICYLGKTRRFCGNRVCGLSVELQIASTEWFRRKMAGEDMGESTWDSRDYIANAEGGSDLDTAVNESRSGVAEIHRSEDACGKYPTIYWKRGAYTPYTLTNEGKEEPVCEPGSILWDLLKTSYEWQPSRRKSALELLAEQAPREKDIKSYVLTV